MERKELCASSWGPRTCSQSMWPWPTHFLLGVRFPPIGNEGHVRSSPLSLPLLRLDNSIMLWVMANALKSVVTSLLKDDLPFWDSRRGKAEKPRKGCNFFGLFATHPQWRLMYASESAKSPAWNRKCSLCTFDHPRPVPMERRVFTFSLFRVKAYYISKTIYFPLPFLLSALLISETFKLLLWKWNQSFKKWKPTHLGLCIRVVNTERFYTCWPAKGHLAVQSWTPYWTWVFCCLMWFPEESGTGKSFVPLLLWSKQGDGAFLGTLSVGGWQYCSSALWYNLFWADSLGFRSLQIPGEILVQLVGMWTTSLSRLQK